MYAVVELKGHQYIVKAGDVIEVDSVSSDEQLDLNSSVVAIFDEDGKNVKVGKPYLTGVSIDFELGDSRKGDKILVTKFKRKNRYERNIGFRPYLTALHIKNIKA